MFQLNELLERTLIQWLETSVCKMCVWLRENWEFFFIDYEVKWLREMDLLVNAGMGHKEEVIYAAYTNQSYTTLSMTVGQILIPLTCYIF